MNNYTPLQRFWLLLKPDAREVRNIYVYAAFSGIINLSLPLGISAIVNLIQGGRISTSWVILLIFVIGGVALGGILQIFQLRITENLQQKIFARAAFEFTYRIPRIRLQSLYNQYAPELMNRFFDTISLQKGLAKILIDFSTAAMQMVLGLVLLSFYHPFFILFSIAAILLVVALFFFTAKPGMKTSLKESMYKYRVVHWLEELARTNTTFKLSGNSELPMNRTNQNVDSYLNARESHFRVLVWQYSMMVLFKVLITSGLLIIGGMLVMEQQMNIGQFVAAEIIILLVLSSVEKLLRSMETIYDVLTSLEKIGQVTDLELEKEGGEALVATDGLKVSFEKLEFSYPMSKKQVLKGIDLTIDSGEKHIIIGEDGSGKSTLLYLLSGLYNHSSGNISINDIPFENLNINALRSMIGDCLMEEQLFEGSIADNISMGKPNIGIERVIESAKNIGLDATIKQLDGAYAYQVQPEGKGLAKSTIQKILLARSIAAKPRLLLIKDSFGHLPSNERETIINFLCSKKNPWTLICVSHDPYFASKCDQIHMIEDGIISRSGKMNNFKDLSIFKSFKNA